MRSLTLICALIACRGTGGGTTGGSGGTGGGGGGGSRWLVGTGGTLVSSAASRYDVHASPTTADLFGLTCSGKLHGWAVGAGGVVIASSDGGEHWISEASGVGATLRAVFFADADRGLVAGDGGTLLATSDGGAHFTALAAGSADLRAVAITRNSAWAVGDGVVLRSLDGGEFSPLSVPGGRGVRFSADGQLGVIVGEQVLASRDGGASWSAISTPPRPLRGVSVAADGRRIVAVGEGGLVWRSDDGGASFREGQSTTGAALNAIGFDEDSATGWAVGEGGTVLVTYDDGATFTAQTAPAGVDFTAVEDF
jgi:photosystem II stability/assembly factor-like uncharacterized protein